MTDGLVQPPGVRRTHTISPCHSTPHYATKPHHTMLNGLRDQRKSTRSQRKREIEAGVENPPPPGINLLLSTSLVKGPRQNGKFTLVASLFSVISMLNLSRGIEVKSGGTAGTPTFGGRVGTRQEDEPTWQMEEINHMAPTKHEWFSLFFNL